VTLNTRSKRASSVGVLAFFILAPPFPDGAIKGGDQPHIAAVYSGYYYTPIVARVHGGGSLVVVESKGAKGSPAISGDGTVVLTGRAGARKAILVHGGGTAVAQGWKGAKVAADLSGGGAVVITYTRTGGSIHYAYLPGGGAVVGQGIKEARAPPAVYGGGDIVATGVRFYTDVAVRAPAKYEPIRLVYLYLDYCGNVFGTSPCLATGTPCFNTWKTCKYLSAFDNIGKTYKYSEVDAALPFKGIRPYVKSVKLLPTEIKTNLTVNARVSVTMVDELDQDIDTDPYLAAKGFGGGGLR
jgi:hypothetical protein